MDSELLTLKKELISVSTDTGIGFNCTESTKQQIESLAKKIEAVTPNPEPTNPQAVWNWFRVVGDYYTAPFIWRKTQPFNAFSSEKSRMLR